ncbi:pyridoxal phosphate-dependent aminotransferase [Phenylobacterium sp.]|uniref:pyridoxal phosphate-dependent aminotransferase n=1 Tax=Phenylobacterium sp. TaxID=1871053 RepID=UPI0025D545E8|nr:pyridoxal phosphate-dependent aminotransferase [Phenylobacterium sp.]
MNPVHPNHAAPAQHPAAAGDLFEAGSYAEWGRAAIRIREAGLDVSMLWDSTIAEPTAALAAVVREAFADPVSSRYVSVFADGNRFAVEALGRRYGLRPEQILTTTGATGSLALALKALVQPGEHILVETPGFDVLQRVARDAGAEVDIFRRPAPDFRLDLDDLQAKLKPTTRAVLITNLHNPSGAWLAPDAIKAAATMLSKAGVVLIVDEVYADFAQAAGAPPAGTLAPNVISVSSLTKVFGLFALKFGWLAADYELVARLRRSAPDGDMGVSKLSHAVAAHVLENPAPFETHWRALLAASRPTVAKHVEALVADGHLDGELPPYGCMYFPRVVGVSDTRALAQRLLTDFDVLVAPGEYFGAPGHIRIGFGADPDAIDEGLVRLHAGLTALR